MRYQIKSLLIASVSCLAFLATSLFNSCLPVKCRGVNCMNGGTCVSDNKCVCPTAYEGANCETLSRQKFIGNHQQKTTPDSVNVAAQFAISITSGTNPNDVKITNFNNYFTQHVWGYMSDPNTLTIPSQNVQNYTIQGKAIYKSTDLIEVTYTIDNNNGSVRTVNATW